MKTIYYDGLRGPIAVQPLAIVRPGQVEVRVTARGDNAHPYKTGDILRIPQHSVVYLMPGMRCRSLSIDELRERITKKECTA